MQRSDNSNSVVNAQKKHRLPQKICIVCNKPFAWRKKWKNVWDEVKYCSARCRRNKNESNASS